MHRFGKTGVFWDSVWINVVFFLNINHFQRAYFATQTKFWNQRFCLLYQLIVSISNKEPLSLPLWTFWSSSVHRAWTSWPVLLAPWAVRLTATWLGTEWAAAAWSSLCARIGGVKMLFLLSAVIKKPSNKTTKNLLSLSYFSAFYIACHKLLSSGPLVNEMEVDLVHIICTRPTSKTD